MDLQKFTAEVSLPLIVGELMASNNDEQLMDLMVHAQMIDLSNFEQVTNLKRQASSCGVFLVEDPNRKYIFLTSTPIPFKRIVVRRDSITGEDNWFCGYVKVPKNFYKSLDREEVEGLVIGGITFEGDIVPLTRIRNKKGSWPDRLYGDFFIGFDTGSLFDISNEEHERLAFEGVNRLAHFLEQKYIQRYLPKQKEVK